MRVVAAGLAGMVLASCSAEYEITEAPDAFGEPNAPELENPVNQDRVVQVTIPAVDVLWVVDNSGSMEDNQSALATNFPQFMDYFLGSGLDYHIGVVSTDTQDNSHSGKLREANGERYLTPDTDNPQEVFSQMAQMGTGGSSSERGREAAYLAFTEETAYNAGFVRHEDDTAGVHIIAVSDEQDHSRDTVITIDEYVAFLNDLRPLDDLVTFNSICNPPPGSIINPAGTNYIAVTEGVGGLLRDIKSEDWAEILEALGIQASGLRAEFFLSELPVIDTIEVWVEEGGERFPFERGVDYEYDPERNSIRFFSYIPNALAEVFITYTVLAAVVD